MTPSRRIRMVLTTIGGAAVLLVGAYLFSVGGKDPIWPAEAPPAPRMVAIATPAGA